MSLTTLQNFYKVTLARRMATTGALSMYVSSLPTPSSGWLVISPSNSSLREIVKYSSTGTDANGTYVVISAAGDRGLGGTTAQTHEIGEPVRMNYTSLHQQEMSDALDQIVAGGAQDASTSVKGITKIVPAPVSAASPIALGSNAITIETTSGTTHSLTTVAGEVVIVWAKGSYYKTSSGATSCTVKLLYNGVEKDTVTPYNENNTIAKTFALMYTETPGAATQDITVTVSAGSIADVKIIVMKIKTQ